jgi:copper transport protein
MPVAMLAIGWTYSASGHASAWGDFSLAQLIDGLHVASTAVWLGGLLMLATSARPRCSSPGTIGRMRSRRPSACRGSRASLSSVSSPPGSTKPQIGFLSALWETAYGRLLLLKLAGVLGMEGSAPSTDIAACLRCGTGPRVAHLPHTPSGSERFLRIATVESLLAVWVLGCTALLTGATPPRQGSPDATRYARRGRGFDSPCGNRCAQAHCRGCGLPASLHGIGAGRAEALDLGAATRTGLIFHRFCVDL